MQALRSIAALVAGFGFMASTVMVGTMVANALFGPDGLPPQAQGSSAGTLPVSYLVANLAVNFLGAVFGGWLAARIGASAPFGHAAALAGITAVLSIGAVLQPPAGPHPAWYPIAVGMIGVAGILAGGKLRAAAASTGAVVA